MTNDKTVIEEILSSYWNGQICKIEAKQQLDTYYRNKFLGVLPKYKCCNNSNYTPEQICTRDMAIDAGDLTYEGSIVNKEKYEECGKCKECIYNQVIDDIKKVLGE